MNKKPNVKPVHLAFIGLAIIALGVLIPSFFISPFSTIGLSVIIGSIILLAAYTIFAINVIKSKGKNTIKWLVLPVILALLVCGGLFANYKYRQNLNDRIYSIGDSISFPDFTLSVDKPSFGAVDISIPQDKVSRYGGLDKTEDCSKYPEDNNKPADYYNSATGKWVMYNEGDWEKEHPTKFYCEWRNGSRHSISKYITNNQRMAVNYKLSAFNNVDSSKVNISLLPDSGRTLNANETLFDYDSLLSKDYAPPFNYAYHPYKQKELGGDINKGITRQGSITTDIRNEEQSVDLKVTYKNETRLVRITR